MNRKLTLIIALQTLLIITLFWVLVFYGKDEYESYKRGTEEAIISPSLVKEEHGINMVTLPIAVQQNSDIKTSSLQPSQHQGVITSYGTVISIDGLIDLKSRYQAAIADASVISASSASQHTEYQRLKTLNADDKNVSDRAVAEAYANVQSNQARITASEATANSIRETMRQQWGDLLTQLALKSTTSILKSNEVLLQILLPLNSPEPTANSTVQINIANTNQAAGISATYIARSTNTDASLPGTTYFYRARDKALRVGMRVQASYKTADSANKKDSKKVSNGVIIPNSAVVWYGGKAWVYVKQSTNQFIRKPITTDNEVSDGWFNQDTLEANEEVVTSGAQLLLSEEFKSEIKNENKD
ncbi:MAG: hypothetical protein H7Z18_07965 [Methylophilaceae bacterium]|nr:hypothetical protein [Methylophilaceae bacterium]